MSKTRAALTVIAVFLGLLAIGWGYCWLCEHFLPGNILLSFFALCILGACLGILCIELRNC